MVATRVGSTTTETGANDLSAGHVEDPKRRMTSAGERAGGKAAANMSQWHRSYTCHEP